MKCKKHTYKSSLDAAGKPEDQEKTCGSKYVVEIRRLDWELNPGPLV